jgi:hypothetical protein
MYGFYLADFYETRSHSCFYGHLLYRILAKSDGNWGRWVNFYLHSQVKYGFRCTDFK